MRTFGYALFEFLEVLLTFKCCSWSSSLLITRIRKVFYESLLYFI